MKKITQKCHRHKLHGNYGNSQALVDLEYSKQVIEFNN